MRDRGEGEGEKVQAGEGGREGRDLYMTEENGQKSLWKVCCTGVL